MKGLPNFGPSSSLKPIEHLQIQLTNVPAADRERLFLIVKAEIAALLESHNMKLIATVKPKEQKEADEKTIERPFLEPFYWQKSSK